MRILNPGPAVASSDDFAGAAARAARGNRRRLQVFASVFILCLVVGMAWNLLRSGPSTGRSPESSSPCRR